MDNKTSCTLVDGCTYVRDLTPSSIGFIVFVFAGIFLTWLILGRFKKDYWKRFLIMAVGILIFEVFTAPMWHNYHLGRFAYVYKDVSWILNLGWTSLILGTILLVEKLLPKIKAWQKYLVELLLLTPIIFLLQIWEVNIGVRGFAQETLQATSGLRLFNVPVEGFYYAPVFSGLVIAFYKYWALTLDKVPLMPVIKRNLWRTFLIAFVGVFAFELLVNPMVENKNFPSWTYIYQDISIVLTGIWIFGLWLSDLLIQKWFINLETFFRFCIAVCINSVLAIPLELFFITNQFRIYSGSTINNFSGYYVFGGNLAVEILFAIPCYLALIISFVRYFETILDNDF
jgi:hypothetical protein